MKKTVLLVGLLLGSSCLTTNAQIEETGMFTGDVFEDFTSLLGTPVHVQTVDAFDGDVTLNNLTEEGSIFVASGSSLGGDLVTAYSAPLAIAQLGVLEWDFHVPIDRFGAYFENNSRFDDATLEFYDEANALIGTGLAEVAEDGQQWVWNAWESDVPVHRIVSRGHDIEFLSGFIWFDNLQISYATLFGDVNEDGSVDMLDVQPFVDRVTTGTYQSEADMNQDGAVDLLDVQLFVTAVTS